MTPITFDLDSPRQASSEQLSQEVILPWHRTAIIAIAAGQSLFEVSKALNRPIRELQSFLSSPLSQAELSRLSNRSLAGPVEQSQLSAAAPEAIFTLQSLLHSSPSDNIRLAAAKEILDRTLGKPTQNIVTSRKTATQSDEEEIASLRSSLLSGGGFKK
jgi:hypothetical protein